MPPRTMADEMPTVSDEADLPLFVPVVAVSVLAMLWYIVISLFVLEPRIETLYHGSRDVFFALTHAYDARQYVYICNQGYTFPSDSVVYARIDWMPVYSALQCGLHSIGVSLIFSGWLVSVLAIGVGIAFAILTLRNLHRARPWLYSLVLLTPVIGGAWLYMSGVEATFLAVGMVVMWLITLPAARTAYADLARAAFGLLLGVVFILTKPNALALILPLIFAFIYQSWRRSQAAGYGFGFGAFAADLVIEHTRPLLIRIGRLFNFSVTLAPRPMIYDWTALYVVAGIGLGMAFWLWFSSDLSGVPFFFLQNQSQVSAAWPSGNLSQMIAYFAQAFRGWGWPGAVPAWRYSAAWYLASNVSAIVPAGSKRVPPLIRGMLLLNAMFLLYSGAVGGSTRYVLSTAVVVIGWACWVAPAPGRHRTIIGSVMRAAFVLTLCVITWLLLVNVLMPINEPNVIGIIDQ